MILHESRNENRIDESAVANLLNWIFTLVSLFIKYIPPSLQSNMWPFPIFSKKVSEKAITDDLAAKLVLFREKFIGFLKIQNEFLIELDGNYWSE